MGDDDFTKLVAQMRMVQKEYAELKARVDRETKRREQEWNEERQEKLF